jgi:hypothetical protein
VPFAHTYRRIGDIYLLQEPLDLRTAQSAFSIRKDAAGGFEVLRIKYAS